MIAIAMILQHCVGGLVNATKQRNQISLQLSGRERGLVNICRPWSPLSRSSGKSSGKAL
jgi:hypothetical protein